MLHSPAPHRLRRRALIALIVGVAILAAVTGGYLALSGPSAGDRALRLPAPANASTDGVPTVEATPELTQITTVSDPESFAKAVAHALFDWDTTAPMPLAEYAGRLLAVADPTGAESSGLVADLHAYLPTTETWGRLKPYYTRQWMEIESIEVPPRWSQAEAEAGPDGLAAGTTAYTVHGRRHRSGVWEAENVTSEHHVSFTMFIVCAPTYPACRLLRLSRLNDPLT